MHSIESRWAWVGAGLLVISAVWWALLHLLPARLGTGFATAALLTVWCEGALLPELLLGRPGRPVRWLMVAAALPLCALAVAIGGAVGFGTGVVFYLVAGLPGFPVGGAIAGGLSAALLRRLLDQPVSPGRAAWAGALTASILAGGSLTEPELDLVGLLNVMSAALPSLILTAPVGAGIMPGQRRRRGGRALLVAASLAPAILLWLDQQDLLAPPAPSIEAAGLRCLDRPDPGCLADTASRLVASEWPAVTSNQFQRLRQRDLWDRTVRDLVRAGHGEQARSLAAASGADVQHRIDMEMAMAAIVDQAVRDPAQAADLVALETLAQSATELIEADANLADDLTGRTRAAETSLHGPLAVDIPARIANRPALRALADRWQAAVSRSNENSSTFFQLRLARLQADLDDLAQASVTLGPVSAGSQGDAGIWAEAGDGIAALELAALWGPAKAWAVEPRAVVAIRRAGARDDTVPRLQASAAAVLASRRREDLPDHVDFLTARVFVDALLDLDHQDDARLLAHDMLAAARDRRSHGGLELLVAAAALTDVGETGLASRTLDMAARAYRVRPDCQDEDRLHCLAPAMTSNFELSLIVVHGRRLGRSTDLGSAEATDVASWADSQLLTERPTSDCPIACLLAADRGVGFSVLLSAAGRWATRGDGDPAAALLERALAAGGDDGVTVARLAIRIGRQDLAVKAVRQMLDRVRGAGPGNDAASELAAIAAFWHLAARDLPEDALAR